MATIRISTAVAALVALTTPATAQTPSLAGKNVQMIDQIDIGVEAYGEPFLRNMGGKK